MSIAKEPTKVKTFLKHMMKIADSGDIDFSDWDSLSKEEQQQLGNAIADIQNALGDMEDTLIKKYNLEWN